MIKAKRLEQILHKCKKDKTVLDIKINGVSKSYVYISDFDIDTKFVDYYNLKLNLSDNSEISILLNEKWGYQSREALLRYKHNGPICHFEVKVVK